MTIDAEKYPLFLQMRTPLSRRRDPSTSGQASTWLRGSGRLARQERLVYAGLRLHPGSTSRELAAVLDCADPNVPARRLAGLADRGLVRRGPKRACRVSRMLCQVWYVNAPKQQIGTLAGGQQEGSRLGRRDASPLVTLSPGDRRQELERMAASGDPAAKGLLATLSKGGGIK